MLFGGEEGSVDLEVRDQVIAFGIGDGEFVGHLAIGAVNDPFKGADIAGFCFEDGDVDQVIEVGDGGPNFNGYLVRKLVRVLEVGFDLGDPVVGFESGFDLGGDERLEALASSFGGLVGR